MCYRVVAERGAIARCFGMYLRTTVRRNADGTDARYHQLAENT